MAQLNENLEEYSNKNETFNIPLQPEDEPLTWRLWRRRRYIVILLIYFGFFNIYALRVNLSVGIVVMTETRTIHHENGTTEYEQDFDWNSKEKGLILSAFFYGYILTQLIGGYIAVNIGGSLAYGIGVLVTSVLTILTPLAAYGGIYALIAVRFVEGVFEGVTFPCCQAIFARWLPPNERSRMITLSYAGAHTGTVISMPICGLLATYFGWESIFYCFGTIGCIWFILWICIVRKDPAEDKYISSAELRYIQESLENVKNDNIKPPWKAMCTSTAVMGICVAHFCENWGFYTMLTELPTFLKDTMNFDIKEAGFLSAAPYLVMVILLPTFGSLADYCQIKQYLTTTQVRKYFNTIGFLAQTIFMLLAAYFLNPIGSIVCLIMAVGIGSMCWSGFGVNNLDIAPQYACIILGLSNTFATIPGIICPTIAGYIVQNKSASEWQIVFYIAASVYLMGCIIFWYCVSAELQPWAKPKNAVILTNDNKHNNNSALNTHTHKLCF